MPETMSPERDMGELLIEACSEAEATERQVMAHVAIIGRAWRDEIRAEQAVTRRR